MKSTIFLLSFLFLSVLGYSQNNSANCNCCTETHSQFDFWIGDWVVTNPDGKNSIDKIQDKCILRENWTSAKGNFTGTSYNFYNAQKKQWEQIWVDNQGGNLHLKGHRKGNQMILRTENAKNKNGQTFYH
ncbi:hypothetical protein [Gaetbulibacter sp. NE]|uniref:hypothetical protein n=1 Tax=Gaetbulibacter sp. NE TaxID=2982307 RepID=UPI0021D100BC|nr:hypothetical protein [Gaetbulibacter sp. NE]